MQEQRNRLRSCYHMNYVNVYRWVEEPLTERTTFFLFAVSIQALEFRPFDVTTHLRQSMLTVFAFSFGWQAFLPSSYLSTFVDIDDITQRINAPQLSPFVFGHCKLQWEA